MSELGAVSCVYLLDYRRYRGQVVPALRRLRDTGMAEPWLRQAWEDTRPDPFPGFTGELREASAALMASPDLSGGRLPLSSEGSGAWERLQDLFQLAVERSCLGEGVYLGNATWITDFQWCNDMEDVWNLAGDERIWPLLERLGARGTGRGSAWGHGSGGHGEGVNGWLDPDETRQLEGGLNQLVLPPFEATFEAVDRARRERAGTCSDHDDCPQALAAVRALAGIAVRRELGILQGMDLHHGASIW